MVSWLPLSHDMGLFSWLLCWARRVPHLMGEPQRFVSAPWSWLGDCAAYKATITPVPPFALPMAIRADRVRPLRKSLSIRSCIVGGDRLDWASVAAAGELLRAKGAAAHAVTPAYGLAEATLAVTMTPVADSPRCLSVDRELLLTGELRSVGAGDSRACQIVSAGRPLKGTTVRIEPRAPHETSGEIHVRSGSLASGYYRSPGETSERFHDGECRTADLGALVDDDLYVVGRLDDLLIVAGRNVHARDLEAALEDAGSLRPRSCAGGRHLER